MTARSFPALFVLLCSGLLLLPVVVMPASVQAQQTDPSEDPALPDLASREFEIRGQLEIQFPSLERQPLVGFNPPPRMAQVQAGRRPFTAPYKQDSADLPPSPLQRPDPPAVSSLTRGLPQRGEIGVGAGTYFSRFAYANIGGEAGNGGVWWTDIDYQGSDGDTVFPNSAIDTPYDALEGLLGVRVPGQTVGMAATVEGFTDQYTLYGVERAVALQSQPNRDGFGAGGSLTLFNTDGAYDVSATLHGEATRFETEGTQGPAPLPERFIQEQRAGIDAHVEVPYGPYRGYATGSFAGAQFDGNAITDYTAFSGHGGIGARWQTAGGYDLTVGAHVLGFDVMRSSTTGIGDFGRTGIYIAPLVRMSYSPSPGFIVYAETEPTVEAEGIQAMYRHNPYLVDDLRVQPTVLTIDLEGGVRYFMGSTQFVGRVGFQESPNYRYFERARPLDRNGFSRGLTTAQYDAARIFAVGGDVSFMVAGTVQATLSATLRNGSLTDLDDDEANTDIPYFADVLGQAMVSYAFAQQRGLVQLTAHAEGPRLLDVESTTEVPAFVDLDVLAQYAITPAMALVVQGQNLLGQQERWDNYPGLSQVITGGLRIRW